MYLGVNLQRLFSLVAIDRLQIFTMTEMVSVIDKHPVLRSILTTLTPLIIEQVEMASSEWQLSLKLMDQPKSTFHFPEMMPGDVSPGEYRVATLKQLVAAQLPDSIPDPDLIGWFQL